MSAWDETYLKTSPPWDIGRPQPAIVELVKRGEMKKPADVIDVGCGTGENTIFLAQNGFNVKGVDLSKEAVRMAKAKAKERNAHNVDFRVGNALALEFPSRTFDYAIDSGLFHVFDDPDRPVFASEIGRVLKPGGVYFMMCFSEKEPEGWGGPRRVSKEEINGTFSGTFKVNYIREASFMTRIHENGGKAYLTSATKLP